MKWYPALFVVVFAACTTMSGNRSNRRDLHFFKAANKAFTYTGRFVREKGMMKAWSPGAYMQVGFEGSTVDLEIDDEKRFDAHNYIHVIIDDTIEQRIALPAHENVIRLATGLKAGKHKLLICKDTESGMGYIAFKGLSCRKIFRLPIHKRRIEFIGDSITCGNGSDTTQVSCANGTWYDQHNAYQSFGPVTARKLNAGWILSSVSGIGMTRSCCGLKITMPEVYDRINLDSGGPVWTFPETKPDLVIVTLGQNDGIVDSLIYCRKYEIFVRNLRKFYPSSTIVCCSSPMADDKLMEQMSRYIPAIEAELHKTGDLNVRSFIYKHHYRAGCFFHPTISQHEEISEELLPFLKEVTEW